MTLDFLYNNYDLTNLEIKNAEIKSGNLILNVIVSAHLELIANGYRPELDVEHEIEFKFVVKEKDKKYIKPVISKVLYDKNLVIYINNDVLVISDNNVLVAQKS